MGSKIEHTACFGGGLWRWIRRESSTNANERSAQVGFPVLTIQYFSLWKCNRRRLAPADLRSQDYAWENRTSFGHRLAPADLRRQDYAWENRRRFQKLTRATRCYRSKIKHGRDKHGKTVCFGCLWRWFRRESTTNDRSAQVGFP